MSVRLLTLRFIKHGRHFLQSYWRRDIHTNILEQNQTRTRQRLTATGLNSNVLKPAARNTVQAITNSQLGSNVQTPARSGIFRLGQHARKLFIDNILSRVTSTYAQEIRQQATKKLFYGDSAPFFALVGVSLASGAGVLTKEDELEGVCLEIREAASRLQTTWSYDEISETLDERFNMDKLDIGPPIAKGCAAVVYAAALKTELPRQSYNTDNANTETAMPTAVKLLTHKVSGPELLSPMQHMSRFVHNFGGSVDNLNVYNQSVAAAAFAAELAEHEQQIQQKQEQNDDIVVGKNTSSNDYSYQLHALDNSVATIQRYPLALKMMFNYDIQSNALCILRAMYRETVPARQQLERQASVIARREDEAGWERLLREATMELAPHPNIVCMYGYFCDEVRELPEGSRLYPVAQPPRINPDGYGRNMSLYLLMKRYDYSLRELLDLQKLSMRTRLLLFAQLLEAVAHLGRHGIAHRDIKSDNLLIELIEDEAAPLLVLSDFGCCLADRRHGLQLPYGSMDIDKGGNAALMAPEIINKQPGTFSVLNYAKADLWACGAIAYEIFGQRNPFYKAPKEQIVGLRNSEYKQEELPKIENEDCPELVQQLIYNILHPNPSKRVSPDIAANVMQLILWAPSQWLKAESSSKPNSPEILQWLLSLSSKVMCEGRVEMQSHHYGHQGRRTYVEYLLLCSFLSRVKLRRVRGALNWIQNVF